ncbi:MAG: sulfotransferase family 2 domain-containing protein [Pseudomonadota bacterium]
MILSHAHQFIFLKTIKTAGTSFEMALSKFCNKTDIITSIDVDNEQRRSHLGFQTAQNYRVPLGDLLLRPSMVNLMSLLRGRWPKAFHQHMTGEEVKNRLPPDIWNSYRRISIVRNPFDRIISHYYFERKNQSDFPTFPDWLTANTHELRRNEAILWSGRTLCATHILRYENLLEDTLTLERDIPGLAGLSETLSGLSANTGTRPKGGTGALDLFAGRDDLIGLVKNHCAKELDAFGYMLSNNPNGAVPHEGGGL